MDKALYLTCMAKVETDSAVAKAAQWAIDRIAELESERDECARVSRKALALSTKNWERATAAEDENKRLREALGDLVEVLESAGLLNLSNGVQLRSRSWFVKASARVQEVKDALADQEPVNEYGPAGGGPKLAPGFHWEKRPDGTLTARADKTQEPEANGEERK